MCRALSTFWRALGGWRTVSALLSNMASTSDGGEGKDHDLDANDVELAIDDQHFASPTPTDANASTQSRLPAPERASGSTEPSAQDRRAPDPLTTAGARRQAFQRFGSAVSAGEDPLTEERHSEQPTKCSQHTWFGHVSYLV